jgi:predicted naringenin-chalcone synthase
MNSPSVSRTATADLSLVPIARLLGVGTCAPEFSILQSEAAQLAQALKVSESGVTRRGSVLLNSDQGPLASRQGFYPVQDAGLGQPPSTQQRMEAYARHASPLLQKACMHALAAADLEPTAVTHVVTVSCTGFYSPGLDFSLIEQLKLSGQVQRCHLGFMGCHGALNGLNMARAITQADPSAMVLLGAVELCSLHQQYTDDPEQLVANALFADGAAAVVMAGQVAAEKRTAESETDASWRVVDHFSAVLPGSTHMMSWRIGDHGFVMSLDSQVPALIENSLRRLLEPWLASHGMAVDNIDSWAIHPGGPRIVESTGRALGLLASQLAPSLGVLANYGNMSSPTVLFILQQLEETSDPGQAVVMVAFGPGLCVEACLLERI